MSRVEPERNVYVGHRYVPKIFGEWDNQNEYEGLSIVTHQGGSYTSKKRVPVGIDILNNEFWVATGNYDAQVEYYRDETERVSKKLDTKTDKTYVDNELDKKSDQIYVDNELEKINILSTKKVNVESFKRLAGETDDTERIKRAYATVSEGDTFVIPNNYTISNVIFDKDHVTYEWTGWLQQLENSTGTAVTFGKDTPTSQIKGHAKVRKSVRNWEQDNTGIRFLNMNEAEITVTSEHFTKGVVLEGKANGTAYNNITIQKISNAQKMLSFETSLNGWVNENKFYGGRFIWTSNVTDTDRFGIYIPSNTMNNNIFFSPSLENHVGGTLIYCNGQYNTFYSPRLETSDPTVSIIFDTNSLYNQIIYPYSHTNINTNDGYIDRGSRNHIYGRDQLILKDTIVQANAFVGKGIPDRNNTWGNEGIFEGQSTRSQTDKVWIGRSPNGDETSNIQGNGDAKFRGLEIGTNNKKIQINGSFTGGWKLANDGSFYENGVGVVALKKTAGAPTKNEVTIPGSLVVDTVEHALYVYLESGERIKIQGELVL